MSRLFFINNIKSKDVLQKLTKQLSTLDDVSRIKVDNNTISFYCNDPLPVIEILDQYKSQIEYREISEKKQVSDDQALNERIFLLSNISSSQEGDEIISSLQRYDIYQDVSLDYMNKLLKLKTKEKVVINRIRRLIKKINEDIKIEEVKQNLNFDNLFQEKLIKSFFRWGIFALALAFFVVTRNEISLISDIAVLVLVAIIVERNIKEAIVDIKNKHYITDNLLKIIALLFGWFFGVLNKEVFIFVEVLAVALVIRLESHVFNYLMHKTVRKIDRLIDTHIVLKRVTDDGFEEVGLDDIDLDDIVIYEPKDTVVLGGEIVDGRSNLDMFAITGKDQEIDSQTLKHVASGTLVLDDIIKVKITNLSYKTAQQKAHEVASSASLSESKAYILIQKISTGFTYFLIGLGLVCGFILPIYDIYWGIYFIYCAAVIFTVCGMFAYKQTAQLTVFAGVMSCLKNDIVIKENAGLDDLYAADTIIYDRFDGVEVSVEELELFSNLQKLHKELIIFNDGPVDLENSQYNIYNNLSLEQKHQIMNKQNLIGPVVYIGDSDKDSSLMRQAYVGISRGGIHNRKIMANSDIILLNSNLDTLVHLFKIASKQRAISLINILLTIFVALICVVLALVGRVNWLIVSIITVAELVFMILNTWQIIDD